MTEAMANIIRSVATINYPNRSEWFEPIPLIALASAGYVTVGAYVELTTAGEAISHSILRVSREPVWRSA
jgi:hypothetical protein